MLTSGPKRVGCAQWKFKEKTVKNQKLKEASETNECCFTGFPLSFHLRILRPILNYIYIYIYIHIYMYKTYRYVTRKITRRAHCTTLASDRLTYIPNRQCSTECHWDDEASCTVTSFKNTFINCNLLEALINLGNRKLTPSATTVLPLLRHLTTEVIRYCDAVGHHLSQTTWSNAIYLWCILQSQLFFLCAYLH
jgi:hypothetical protein